VQFVGRGRREDGHRDRRMATSAWIASVAASGRRVERIEGVGEAACDVP